ncbi:metallophosphoesterase family protein [Wukongibacter baidiensis]|uniref:metallophosphoesterase family protein n=1 Tax=Wukongibacter baidiensis TaxID=1723361 RepID=UPI003D7FE492
MKIALISDIHGNLIALREVLLDIENRNIDSMYCLGDLVGYGPFPNEVIDVMKEKGIPTVQGNYDEKVTKDSNRSSLANDEIGNLSIKEQILIWTQDNISKENIKWLESLPEKIEVEVEGRKVLLVHGSPRRNNEYLYEGSTELDEIGEIIDVDVMACGHTHKAYHEIVNGIHMINSGTVGRPKDGSPDITYMIIDITDNNIETEMVKLEYDYEAVAKAIEDSDLPNEMAEKIRKGVK